MEQIQESYETAARFMVTAYEQTKTQNDAVEFVRRHFQGVDTLTLIAMWKAVDAYRNLMES